MPNPGSDRPPLLPGDILAELIPSHGNVRHFLETVALHPLDQESQRAAGEAAALAALGELYGIDSDELLVGFRSVHGASHAAGGIDRLSEPHPDIPQDAGAAAFFDVDNTLVQGASIFLFGAGLARRGFFDRGELTGMLWKQIKFRVSGSENPEDVAEALDLRIRERAARGVLLGGGGGRRRRHGVRRSLRPRIAHLDCDPVRLRRNLLQRLREIVRA